YLDAPVSLLHPADNLRLRSSADDCGSHRRGFRVGGAGHNGDFRSDDRGIGRGPEVDARAAADFRMVAQRCAGALLRVAESVGLGVDRKEAGAWHPNRELDADLELGAVRRGHAQRGAVSFLQAELLMKASLLAVSLLIGGCTSAQMGGSRIDPA